MTWRRVVGVESTAMVLNLHQETTGRGIPGEFDTDLRRMAVLSGVAKSLFGDTQYR
jgi:hypothetical protein